MDFPPLDELVEALMEDGDSQIRVEAARLIGEMSHTLNPDDREFAKQALNRAMTDPDPMVLMAVMNAIGQFPSAEVVVEDDEEIDDAPPIQAEVCPVCGKPLALFDHDECQ